MHPSTPAHLRLAGDYRIDPDHSRLGFAARHAMVTKVRGAFSDFDGEAFIGDDPSESFVRVSIKAESISTNNQQRDDHVKGADFLDVDNHPELSFVSRNVELVDKHTYRITGDLTIRDVTKPVTVDFEFTGSATDAFGNERAGFEGSTSINRSDYGITFNAALEAGGVMVSDKISLEFDISAVRVVSAVA